MSFALVEYAVVQVPALMHHVVDGPGRHRVYQRPRSYRLLECIT